MTGRRFSLPFAKTHHAAIRRDPGQRHITLLQIVIITYLCAVLVGASLLLLPAARAGGQLSLLDAIFTAAPAVTLTGLTVQDTATWSNLGLFVIAALMQFGGIFYMTAATLVALRLGLRSHLLDALRLRDIQGGGSKRGALRLLAMITLVTLAIEAIGALALTLRTMSHEQLAFLPALAESAYNSVSAFCHGGFSVGQHWQDDSGALIILGLLMLLGSLGFGVLAEIALRHRLRRMSLHGKIVIMMTLSLIVIGALAIYFFEVGNSATLATLPDSPSRWITAAFMSVSARSGGFNPISISHALPPTLLIISLLMLIGASPESTGSGLKTTTVGVMLLAMLALLRRRRYIEIMGRRISGEMVRLAMSLTFVYMLFVLAIIIAIGPLEVTWREISSNEAMALYGRLIFETISAIGNVGFNTGVTDTLQPISRALFAIAMLLGRIGPLAFVFIFSQPKRPVFRTLPEEPVLPG